VKKTKADIAKKQEQHPNFRNEDGKLFLVRCFACDRENWAPAVATGACEWCGWSEDTSTLDTRGKSR